MSNNWEQNRAAEWSKVIKGRKIVRVEATGWPRVCLECNGDKEPYLDIPCWKCHGSGEDSPEPAVKLIFDNGAELYVRSEFAAALFMKKAD